jgi:hypothetical protein
VWGEHHGWTVNGECLHRQLQEEMTRMWAVSSSTDGSEDVICGRETFGACEPLRVSKIVRQTRVLGVIEMSFLLLMVALSGLAYVPQFFLGDRKDYRMAMRHGMAGAFTFTGIDHFVSSY